MPTLKTKHSFGKQRPGRIFNKVIAYAKEMRLNPTLAEKAFLNYLKKAYLGHISHQHHFIGKENAFILDFYLPEKLIAFEVDGWHHYNNPKQIAKDKFKDNYCKAHGIKIYRIKNQDALIKHIAQPFILKAIKAKKELIDLASIPDKLVKLIKNNQA